jgi:tetratricopeptide (TPR) repeat protein
MKKIVLTLIISFISLSGFSQSKNIQNAYNSFRQETDGVKTKIAEAKDFIDLACKHESTSNDPKMWNYRSKIYLEIMLKHPELDENAVFEATEAHIRCLDRDKKGRIAVRKWTKEEDVLNGLVQCGYNLFNSGVEDYNAKDFSAAIKKYKEIFRIIPLDKDNLLKRGNIVPDAIYYNLYLAALQLEDISAQIEYLQKSIDNNTNNPGVYVSISSAYAKNGDTEKALEYINIGQELFDSDIQLINAEIDLYMKIGKSNEEIIQKLTEAIELDDLNEILYAIRAERYMDEGLYVEAEQDLNFIISEINPESEIAADRFTSLYNTQIMELEDIIKNDKLTARERNDVNWRLGSLYEISLPYLISYNENHPNSLPGLRNLASTYFMIDQYTKCNNCMDKYKIVLQELIILNTNLGNSDRVEYWENILREL